MDRMWVAAKWEGRLRSFEYMLYPLHTRPRASHQKYSPQQDHQDSAPANRGMPVNLCKGSEIVYRIWNRIYTCSAFLAIVPVSSKTRYTCRSSHKHRPWNVKCGVHFFPNATSRPQKRKQAEVGQLALKDRLHSMLPSPLHPKDSGGAWGAQPVKLLSSAQVMIPGSCNPACIGLPAQRGVCFSLSLCPSISFVTSLSDQ